MQLLDNPNQVLKEHTSAWGVCVQECVKKKIRCSLRVCMELCFTAHMVVQARTVYVHTVCTH